MDSGSLHAKENGCRKNAAGLVDSFHPGNSGAAGKEQIDDPMEESDERTRASSHDLAQNAILQKEEGLETGTDVPGVRSRNGSVIGHTGENPDSNTLSTISTQSRLQRRSHVDGTLQDLMGWYCQQDKPEEDDDEDDSDWEPHLQDVVSGKWFCINCTMPNFDDVLYCDFCGEFQESEILTKGFFASPVSREGFSCNVQAIAGHPEPRMERPPSKDCTLVGFDERMLLHSEVEQKSHPHPERPDRVRAIAASFALAGIFPGKCFAIPAREASLEELGLDVHHGNGTQEIFEGNRTVSLFNYIKLIV
ncbi:unnamed protein product [Victoria cruziana]